MRRLYDRNVLRHTALHVGRRPCLEKIEEGEVDVGCADTFGRIAARTAKKIEDLMSSYMRCLVNVSID